MHKVSNQRNVPEPEYYSETEAAKLLGITIERLHRLLDENIFNDGTTRPANLQLRYADLVLLAFWERGTAHPKVIRMPRRS
jgi:hypothetical protein